MEGVTMASWIFTDGFPNSVTTEQLAELFTHFGLVRQAHIFRADHCSPVGFVEMRSTVGATRALAGLHDAEVYGRRLRVVLMEEKPAAARRASRRGAS
jgi:hypothetical protein